MESVELETQPELEVDRYVFFSADYYRSSSMITDILNRYKQYVWYKNENLMLKLKITCSL